MPLSRVGVVTVEPGRSAAGSALSLWVLDPFEFRESKTFALILGL